MEFIYDLGSSEDRPGGKHKPSVPDVVLCICVCICLSKMG